VKSRVLGGFTRARTILRRPIAVALVSTVSVILCGATLSDNAEDNMTRLLAMPTERRLQLMKNLATFDGLGAEQRQAIRDFEARIQNLDPEKRERYLSILRRYHLWRRSLSSEQKKQLDNASTPEARARVVEKIRAEQLERQRLDPDRFDWIQISALNDLPLFWTAFTLKIWFLIDDEKRAEIAKLEDREAQIRKLVELGPTVKAYQNFSHMRDEIQAEAEAVQKEREGNLKARAQTPKVAAKAKNAFMAKSGPLSQATILRYLRDHRPAKVDAQHLRWFIEECPNWLRDSLASLPPDDARRRMIILYRMLFPEGTEIPKPKPKAPARSPSTKSPGTAAPAPKTPTKATASTGIPL
jgi:hypothetical protein